MALSAKDVHDKQFRLVRQSTGYDIDEVDAFLDEVEAEIARLNQELAEALALAGAPEDAPVGEGVDEATEGSDGAGQPPTGGAARILELAQRTADEYLAEARRTADSLVSEAEERARAAVSSLESQRADLEARVSALRSFESEVRSRLTTYFESQLRDLRSIERPSE